VAEISMFALPEGGQAMAGATVIVPLETLLTGNLTIAIDGTPPKVYPFTFCTQIGCIARIGFTAEEIGQFKKGAKAVLEFALMGDGVPASEVYSVLSTPEGVDRAFAKLDTIKKDVVWWEAGSQAPQLLADGEVAMTTAYNGRIFAAAQNEGKPFQIVWDGQIYENEMFVVPKGAPNMDQAMEFIRFATSTEGLRASASQISYGPARKSSLKEDIIFKDGKTVMAPHLPTAPANMTNALETSAEFWVDHDSELNERFQAWLSQ